MPRSESAPLMRDTFTPDDVLELSAEAEELAQAYLAQRSCPLPMVTMPGTSPFAPSLALGIS